jgi:hypothetical protein
MKRIAVRKPIAHVAASVPSTTFAVASAVDWFARWLDRAPVPQAALSGAPELAFADPELARRASWSASVRYRVLCSALGTPGTPWPHLGLVTVPDVSELPPPMVIATFHIGPMLALGAMIKRLPAETVAVTAGLPDRQGMRSVGSAGDEWRRVQAFTEALQALQADRFVFIAVDGAADRRIEVPLLGRSVSIGAGAFALSRISGAPLLPAAARWRGGKAEVVIGVPIPAAGEEKMAGALARWLEHRIREYPVELGSDFVEFLLRAPLRNRAVEDRAEQPLVTDLAIGSSRDRPGVHDAHARGREPAGGDDLPGDVGGNVLR